VRRVRGGLRMNGLVPVSLLPTPSTAPSTPLRAAAKQGRHFRKVRERMGHPRLERQLSGRDQSQD
jgi:hypothetical protein